MPKSLFEVEDIPQIMEDQITIQKALAKRIVTLEMEIADWRSHNSQSNPGAVFELRSMKKELEAANKAFHASIVLAASIRTLKKTEDEGRKPGDT
jgi:hypothetical protein